VTAWAVTLEQVECSRERVLFESIETGCSLTMSKEAFDHADSPATVTVLVDGEDLWDAAKRSRDAEPVGQA
jgi:hypothetical protein